MPSTLTPQYIIDVVSTSKGMKPLVGVGGIANQPGLSICNQTLQKLLCSPYSWRFNKSSIGVFTTIANQQDYLISGCNIVRTGRWAVHVNAQNSTNGAGLTEAGTTVTATFNDFAPNGFPAGAGPVVGDPIVVAGAADPKYNISATVTAVPTTTSLQYTAAGGAATPDGGQGISNINWMEHVTLSDFQSSATVIPVHDIEIAASLPMESIIQPPMKFAYQVDTVFSGSNLSITCPLMRAWPVPSSQIWGVYLFFQAKAPRIASLAGNWSPFPDDLEFVLVANVKAYALDWWEDPRAVNSLILAKQEILTALGAKDQELRHESMFPDLPLVRGG